MVSLKRNNHFDLYALTLLQIFLIVSCGKGNLFNSSQTIDQVKNFQFPMFALTGVTCGHPLKLTSVASGVDSCACAFNNISAEYIDSANTTLLQKNKYERDTIVNYQNDFINILKKISSSSEFSKIISQGDVNLKQLCPSNEDQCKALTNYDQINVSNCIDNLGIKIEGTTVIGNIEKAMEKLGGDYHITNLVMQKSHCGDLDGGNGCSCIPVKDFGNDNFSIVNPSSEKGLQLVHQLNKKWKFCELKATNPELQSFWKAKGNLAYESFGPAYYQQFRNKLSTPTTKGCTHYSYTKVASNNFLETDICEYKEYQGSSLQSKKVTKCMSHVINADDNLHAWVNSTMGTNFDNENCTCEFANESKCKGDSICLSDLTSSVKRYFSDDYFKRFANGKDVKTACASRMGVLNVTSIDELIKKFIPKVHGGNGGGNSLDDGCGQPANIMQVKTTGTNVPVSEDYLTKKNLKSGLALIINPANNQSTESCGCQFYNHSGQYEIEALATKTLPANATQDQIDEKNFYAQLSSNLYNSIQDYFSRPEVFSVCAAKFPGLAKDKLISTVACQNKVGTPGVCVNTDNEVVPLCKKENDLFTYQLYLNSQIPVGCTNSNEVQYAVYGVDPKERIVPKDSFKNKCKKSASDATVYVYSEAVLSKDFKSYTCKPVSNGPPTTCPTDVKLFAKKPTKTCPPNSILAAKTTNNAQVGVKVDLTKLVECKVSSTDDTKRWYFDGIALPPGNQTQDALFCSGCSVKDSACDSAKPYRAYADLVGNVEGVGVLSKTTTCLVTPASSVAGLNSFPACVNGQLPIEDSTPDLPSCGEDQILVKSKTLKSCPTGLGLTASYLIVYGYGYNDCSTGKTSVVNRASLDACQSSNESWFALGGMKSCDPENAKIFCDACAKTVSITECPGGKKLLRDISDNDAESGKYEPQYCLTAVQANSLKACPAGL